MTLPKKNPLQQAQFAIVDASGKPTQAFAQYLPKLDALVTAMAQGNLPTLVNAANDKAAAAAGVGVGQAYRNASVLMVRVV